MRFRADPLPARTPQRTPLRNTAAWERLGLALLLAWPVVPAGWAWALPAGLRADPDLLARRAAYDRNERGYYERLLAPDRSLDTLADSPAGLDRGALPKAEDVCAEVARLMQPVDDLRERVLRPNLATMAAGAAWTTNALGLRDGPCNVAKPAGTVRIALAGDSIAAGWGVDDGQGFEPLLQRALDVRSRQGGGPAVEIVNLSVPGYSAGARWEQVRRLGWSLAPDVVLFEATVADFGWDERRLRWLLAWDVGWGAPQYRATLDSAGVRRGERAAAYQRALKPYREELLANVYRAAAAECRERGVPCVWILLPRVGRRDESAARARLLQLARQAGFTAVVDVSDAYEGLAPESLAVGSGDYHPNAAGHARLARRLYEELSHIPALQAMLLSSANLSPRERSPAQRAGEGAPGIRVAATVGPPRRVTGDSPSPGRWRVRPLPEGEVDGIPAPSPNPGGLP